MVKVAHLFFITFLFAMEAQVQCRIENTFFKSGEEIYNRHIYSDLYQSNTQSYIGPPEAIFLYFFSLHNYMDYRYKDSNVVGCFPNCGNKF